MKRFEKKKYQQVIDSFCKAQALRDIAILLNMEPRDLGFILYSLNGGREYQYSDFEIPKKKGGVRKISAPNTGLKSVQKRLNVLLQKIYWEKPSVHSFIKKRSIITNAYKHKNKRYIFNIDLKDFFPSIHFGRVRGLFLSSPYNLGTKAATVIAQIACYKKELPQGSPCSPIISNMIGSKMDRELQVLAKNEKCIYTRYADDITFSTNLNEFPQKIGFVLNGIPLPGEELEKIIQENGFQINPEKTNLQIPYMRQEVTGLIVNKFVNVRRNLINQVRAMLHAWEKYGIEAAEKERNIKYLSLPKDAEGPNFQKTVRGKIEFIRMVRSNNQIRNEKQKEDYIAYKLLIKYYDCLLRNTDCPIIRTEGHTDWMHIAAAWEKLKNLKKYKGLKINFLDVKEPKCYGNKTLLSFCQNAFKKIAYEQKVICIFDSDVKDVNTAHEKRPFKNWGNNIHSFILPNVPDFKVKGTSIEMFHQKETLKKKDENLRRLFLSDEFKPDGEHKRLKNIIYGYNPKTKKKNQSKIASLKGNLRIIDNDVFKIVKGKAQNVALSKSAFAKNILKGKNVFQKINFEKFELIFDKIKEIVDA